MPLNSAALVASYKILDKKTHKDKKVLSENFILIKEQKFKS